MTIYILELLEIYDLSEYIKGKELLISTFPFSYPICFIGVTEET